VSTHGPCRWVTDWPGQVVICVDCMYWTRDTGEAVARGTLGEYAEQCTEELMKVVNKVGEVAKQGGHVDQRPSEGTRRGLQHFVSPILQPTRK
jgi:hypothetical protein